MNRLMYLLMAIALVATTPFVSFSQSLSINTDGSTADASAMLDVKSNTKGLLIPRMSRTERNAIAAPATGLLIFQNAPDSIGYYYYNGTAWTWLISNSNADSLAWKTGGNTGTNPLNNFLGTKDNAGLSIKTNNTEAMYIGANGSIGIGTNTPGTGLAQYAKLDMRDETGAKSDFYQFTAGSFGGYPLHAFVKQRGTLAVPAAIVPNEVLAEISAIAHNGSAYVAAGSIVFQNDGVITTTKAPGLISFNTADTGSNTIVQRMVIKGTGNIGVGVNAPVAKFDVAGSAGGTNSVLLRSGNVSNGTASNQLTFGYNGTAQYRHSIKTRHNAGSRVGNAFDFYLWNQGVDNLDTLGSRAAMTLDGNYRGMLGIGTTAPKSEVHISDGSSSLKAVDDGGGYGASMLITDNVIPRIYFEAAAQPANKKLMDIAQINQAIRFNSLTDNGGAADRSDILVVNRDGKVGVNKSTPAVDLDVFGTATIGSGNTNNAASSLVTGINNTINGVDVLVGGTNNYIAPGFGHAIAVGNLDSISGSATAVFGFLNKVTAFEAFAQGDRNTASGQASAAFGGSNTVSSSSGFVTGFSNIVSASQASAFGQNNNISGTNSMVTGSGNTVAANSSLVSGINNTINGVDVLIGGTNNYVAPGFEHLLIAGNTDSAFASATAAFGFLNKVTAFEAFAQGDRNTASGVAAAVFGGSNVASGQSSAAFGNNGAAVGNQSFVTGYLDTAFANSSSAFGTGNSSPSYSEMAVGMYSTTYAAGSAVGYNANDRIFNVGNGSSLAARADAFTILKSGNVGISTATPSAALDINSNKIRLRNAKTPTSATDTGNTGDIAWDTDFIYVCVAANTWKRVAISTW